jgi:serine/threonine-protein kinase
MALQDDLMGRTLLGRYRVVMPIGRGGMGTVYLARTEGAAGFAKPVVVKGIHPAYVGDASMSSLFVREARILSNLHHPGIVNVLDFDEEQGVYVMVLEYVHGYDLGAWVTFITRERHERMPFEIANHVVTRVLDTLHYAHTYRRPNGKPLSIIHRDVSPGNILVDSQGLVKLADFGVARATDDAGEFRSRMGSFKGKLAYSAPELVHGEGATPRSDLYAAAVVLVYALLGHNPFKGDNMGESVQRVVNMRPPRVSDTRADVPSGVDVVLNKALAKNPEQRFQDAQAFADALRALRTRPEEEIQADIADAAYRDFHSDMPDRLGLAALTERDSAWRGLPGSVSRLDSTPPSDPSPSRRVGSDVDTIVSIPEKRDTFTEAPRGTRQVSLLALLAIAGGTTALLAGIGAAVWGISAGFGSSGAAQAPQYVVIERQPLPAEPRALGGAAEAADAVREKRSRVGAEPSAPPPRDAAPSRASAGDLGAVPGSGSAAAPEDPAARLTAALQRQEGRFQACFERHVEHLSGAPQISIRFRLDARGAVDSAELVPGTLAATPLGDCLLQVARATPFPAPGKPISFHVPITARVSR